MTKTLNGSITLTSEDAKRLNALIAASQKHLRDAGVFTSAEATQFAREWTALSKT